jgi:primosomal protein N'
LLDQPEQDDHKQDELTPRYDARKLAAWCAQHAGVEVRAIGNTPTIHIEDEAPTIDAQVTVSIRHPNARSPIPMIQPDVLNTLREHEGHRIIIHPIRGDSARFTCRDCGWQAVCASCGFATAGIEGRAVCRRCGWKGDAPLECGSCGGYDLGKTLPGIDRLKAAWKKHEADIEVEWRTLAVDEVERPFPEGSMVVITDAHLLAGVVEDIRRDERLVIAIRRLAARVSIAKGQLILQCDEQLAPKIEPWLTSEGYAAFRATERTLRAAFGYPPARRLVKLITEGTIDKAPFELRGPYPVAFRTKSQKNRFIYHILPPKDIQTEALIRHLLPLAKTAIIDLDPIAFFR